VLVLLCTGRGSEKFAEDKKNDVYDRPRGGASSIRETREITRKKYQERERERERERASASKMVVGFWRGAGRGRGAGEGMRARQKGLRN
jgi:hypothetical protein